MKNAFLHGDLEEEIYMELSFGYDGQVATGTVCKLKKGSIWAETIPESMVWKIHQSYDKFGL